MRIIQYLSFLFLLILATGCATSRLGYPVESVEIPTNVTLFSTMAENGILNNTMGLLNKSLFDAIYKKKYEEMLSQVQVSTLQSQLNDLFLGKVLEAPDLFSLSPVHVYNWNIEGLKSEDKKALYNYNFSMYKDLIPSKYILALTIDEWGYIVAQEVMEDGPYISITVQLFNKETNESLWGYNSLFHQSTEKEGHGVITLEDIEKIYEKLIEKAVRRYFSRLNKK